VVVPATVLGRGTTITTVPTTITTTRTSATDRDQRQEEGDGARAHPCDEVILLAVAAVREGGMEIEVGIEAAAEDGTPPGADHDLAAEVDGTPHEDGTLADADREDEEDITTGDRTTAGLLRTLVEDLDL